MKIAARKVDILMGQQAQSERVDILVDEEVAGCIHLLRGRGQEFIDCLVGCDNGAVPVDVDLELGDTLFITTYTGKRVFPFDMLSRDLSIVDIGHALSQKCRWNSMCSAFYSVARHSMWVSHHCADSAKLWGLLHDAAEAYLPDIPTNLKPLFPQLIDAENRILQLVADVFQLDWPIPSKVWVADHQMRVTEAQSFMHEQLYLEMLKEWRPFDHPVTPDNPKESEHSFLKQFRHLTQ